MSEEEKQAIERMQEVRDKKLHTFIDELTIVLNLIQKQQTKIKELEADLYSANCTINEYIEERNKLKDKMMADKMEQFDDYVIYLIESYLEIMGE